MFGNQIRKITRSVIVGPSATARVTLFQPSVRLDGHGLEVTIDGKVQDDAAPLSIGNHGRHDNFFMRHHTAGMPHAVRSSNPEIRILISRSVDTADLHTHVGKQLSTLRSTGGILTIWRCTSPIYAAKFGNRL